jgi:hypothetical protein
MVRDPVLCKQISDLLLQRTRLCAADQLPDRCRAAPSGCG